MAKLRVLVAEDDSGTLSFLVKLLRREGCEVSAVSDGREAFDCIKRKQYDILVTNINMPGMHGLDLLRVANNLQPDLIKIVESSQNAPKVVAEAFRLGCRVYITKPFVAKDLKDRIREALKAARREYRDGKKPKEVKKSMSTVEKIIARMKAKGARESTPEEKLELCVGWFIPKMTPQLKALKRKMDARDKAEKAALRKKLYPHLYRHRDEGKGRNPKG